MSKLSWLPEHAEQLKRLRLSAGVEITTLAKKHSLSSAQVRQLEESGDSAFYSPQIKYIVGRKLIRSLGEEITELDFDGHFGSTALEEVPPLISANVQQPSFHPSSHQIFSRPKRRWVPLLLILSTLVLAWYGMVVIPRVIQTPTIDPSALDTKESTQMSQHMASLNNSHAVSNIGALADVLPVSSPSECDWSSTSLDLTPASGSRPGHYIYLHAAQASVVCWKDSAQVQRRIAMKPAESMTLEGRPPFHIYSPDISGIKIYYRGKLIRTPHAGVKHIFLGKD
jgi:hypothetical protein